MQENLVIVESPAKAKTIEKFLGDDFKVMSSYGHIRDLKKKELSIDKETLQPAYVIPKDKEELVKRLRESAKKADKVWLASDEDREGEAISWHLCEVLGLDEASTNRIVFHEITKPAILAAIENPRHLDMNLVNAQQARRVLDRIVGFKLSPVLWRKVKPALSAGRVQSVAVRLIVERELAQHVTREELLGHRVLLAVLLLLRHALRRNDAPPDIVLHALQLRARLNRALGLVLLTRQRVKDEPLLVHVNSPRFVSSSSRNPLKRPRGRS